MKRIYYIIQSDRDITGAALFIVRVGESEPEQRAHASIERAASRARGQVDLLPRARYRRLSVCNKVAGAKQAPRPARRVSSCASLYTKKSC